MERVPPPQILVRVAPRLLGDVLSIALREHGLAVHTCPAEERRARPRNPRSFTVAVVTGSVPADARAGEVIQIDEDGMPRSTADVEGHGLLSPGSTAGFDRLLAALRAAIDRVTVE